MRTEVRFLLAMVLMIGVLVVTNLLFPPIPPESPPGSGGSTVGSPGAPKADTVAQGTGSGGGGDPTLPVPSPAPVLPGITGQAADSQQGPPPSAARTVEVRTPLMILSFTSEGGRLLSARLPRFPSFTRPGSVELIYPDGPGALGSRLLVGKDTLDLRSLPFEVDPPEGIELREGDGPATLRLVYRHPTHPFRFEMEYRFHPDQYLVEVSGRVGGLDASVLFTDLGTGIPFNEPREQDEIRAAAYVLNHRIQGIRSQSLERVNQPRVEAGPFYWAAFKSKYFVVALLAGTGREEDHLGGAVAQPAGGRHQVALTVSQPVGVGGEFAYRLFLGPQEFARLANLGRDMEEVNPYGWKFFRPIIRPFVGIIMWVLVFLHENLKLGYGWVLILFGILMRVVLYPLNQRAMRAQLRNMEVQPLLQEIQTKYKDNPEKLQKEMMKLYKEHGFNPFAGCLPMLLPWPVLIALFFVFQNTIELRGVPFLWLPDLSTPDPYYILPALLGISMFLLQWVSMKSMPQTNPQMKMMLWLMPIMMVFIFLNLASGLNLYYTTANLATLPQQVLIARERKKLQPRVPPAPSK